MKTSTFTGHVSLDDTGRTVLIGTGEQFDDDAEVVQARPEFFADPAGQPAASDPEPKPEVRPDPEPATEDVPEQEAGSADVKPRTRRRAKA